MYASCVSPPCPGSLEGIVRPASSTAEGHVCAQDNEHDCLNAPPTYSDGAPMCLWSDDDQRCDFNDCSDFITICSRQTVEVQPGGEGSQCGDTSVDEISGELWHPFDNRASCEAAGPSCEWDSADSLCHWKYCVRRHAEQYTADAIDRLEVFRNDAEAACDVSRAVTAAVDIGEANIRTAHEKSRALAQSVADQALSLMSERQQGSKMERAVGVLLAEKKSVQYGALTPRAAPVLAPTFGDIMDAVEGAIDSIVHVAESAIPFLESTITSLRDDVMSVMSAAGAAVSSVVASIETAVGDVMDVRAQFK